MSTRNLPNFLCIGAQKAGTSWLTQQLRHNSDIWLPPFKEVHYFDHIYTKDNKKWTKNSVRKGIHRAIKRHMEISTLGKYSTDYLQYLLEISNEEIIFTENWYELIYSRAQENKVKGDITPEYCMISEQGVAYVKELLGRDLKAIFLIREPLSRAWSQLRMSAARRKLNPTPDEWLTMARKLRIQEKGAYTQICANWEKYVESQNLLYIPFNDIRFRPNELLNEIETFLNIGTATYTNTQKVVHGGTSYKLPDSVKEYLQNIVSSEYEFLKEKFSKDFLSRI